MKEQYVMLCLTPTLRLQACRVECNSNARPPFKSVTSMSNLVLVHVAGCECAPFHGSCHAPCQVASLVHDGTDGPICSIRYR